MPHQQDGTVANGNGHVHDIEQALTAVIGPPEDLRARMTLTALERQLREVSEGLLEVGQILERLPGLILRLATETDLAATDLDRRVRSRRQRDLRRVHKHQQALWH